MAKYLASKGAQLVTNVVQDGILPAAAKVMDGISSKGHTDHGLDASDINQNIGYAGNGHPQDETQSQVK